MISESARSFDRQWADLAETGRHPHTGGYRRYALTREDHDLREWFAGEAAGRGLEVTTDRVGNQWAWWGDPDTTPGVVTGSHLDSVPDGGAYDGPLGVVGAFVALDRLRAEGFTPQRPLGIVNFTDEEGARFGVACAGSRVLTGALAAERALGLRDADGLSMAEALRAAGRDPEWLGPDPEVLRRVGAFVELHVEQGRGLIDLDQPVALGTDIWPHGRWRLDFPGEANHAGTTRLEDRRDAMVGLATTVLAARSAATTHGCVATMGKTVIVPGGVNAIPSAATGWLDARGDDEAAVRRTVREVSGAAAAWGAVVTEESWTPTTLFDPVLLGRLRRVLPSAPLLGTGAGHDAGILATAGIPTGMIFVRNPTGVSHSPAEHAERADCLAGATALAEVLTELVGER
ncbi:MAG TPA: allantoate amidohydrolase, partial [Microlunatus sp.]|nr:allantoate amidohydrolase [Microlunatus sp.]